MKIAIRVDAALHIGTGHVMRCLTLADECQRKGHEVVFVCRPFPGNLCNFIEVKEFSVSRLSEARQTPIQMDSKIPHAHWLGQNWRDDAKETHSVLTHQRWDWLIVDHYALDAGWESIMRDQTDRIMVIDDLADRSHECDVLLDQNLYPEMNERYSGLIPNHSIRLLGPYYALLRPEFVEKRNAVNCRDGRIRRILIAFGGTDPDNLTLMSLQAILLINAPEISVDVVVGNLNEHMQSVTALCDQTPNVTLHVQTSNIAELMLNADLSMGGGGCTSWERCALGLPVLVVSLADNQKRICESLAAEGVGHYLGECADVTVNCFAQALLDLLSHPTELCQMSQKSIDLLDAAGCSRVVSAMMEYAK